MNRLTRTLYFILLASLSMGAKKAGQMLEDIRFLPGPGDPVLVLLHEKKPRAKINYDRKSNQMIIELKGVEFPAELTRIIDASSVRGSVTQITPYNLGREKSASKIVVQLKNEVGYKLQQNNAETRIYFKKLSIPNVNKLARKNKRKIKDRLRRRSAATDDASSAKSKDLSLVEELISTLDTPAEDRVYKGTKITFEGSAVSVLDLFRLVGEASGLNIIHGNEVAGTVSLSLKDVPWDQLLDIVLQEKSLKATASGNVIRITTLAKYNQEQEQLRLEKISGARAEPTILAIIPVNYASASEMRTAIQALLIGGSSGGAATPTTPTAAQTGGAGGGEEEQYTQAFARGKIEIDDRTNSLLVTHTAAQIERIKRLIRELDVPTPQVLIESKVVRADETFARAVGVSWGGFFQSTVNGVERGGIGFGANGFTSSDGFSIASGAGNGSFGFRLGSSDFSQISLSLALSESIGESKTVASPRLIVNNKQGASISAGTQIGTTTTTTVGGVSTTSTNFTDASLSLSVTPQVTNSGFILLQLNINNSSPQQVGTQLNISSETIDTKVLVENGSTLVLGGIYTYILAKGNEGVPFFKDLPILGQLFRTNNASQSRSELLIFVTPRIVQAPFVGESDSEDAESKKESANL